MNPLREWLFLTGEWKVASSQLDEFGEKGIVESRHVFTEQLDGAFDMGRHEAWQDYRTVNKSISLLYFDAEYDKFRRKYAFSQGFVNNEVEYYKDESSIRFEVDVEPEPRMFKGTKLRSFIQKISDKEVHLSVEVSKGEGNYESFGVTVLTRS